MKEATATAIVSQYRPPRANAPESAGPCLVQGCDGQLELRHERTYGKVYTACPACERRVLEVKQLRDNVARLQAEIANLKAASAPKKTKAQQQERREARVHRRDEVVRRYLAGESGESIARALGLSSTGVFHILRRRAVPIRPVGRRKAP